MTDLFPQQCAEAATTFPSISTAYARFREGGQYLKLHIRAPDIMVQFSGEVRLGEDPKGVLFYGPGLTDHRMVLFSVFYYKGLEDFTTITTVRVDFYVLDECSHLKSVARFVARVDVSKYPLPPVRPGIGEGRWHRLRSAISQVDVLRQTNVKLVTLQLLPLRKQVTFDTENTGLINQPGTFLFYDYDALKDVPEPDGRCMQVDYTPNHMIFFTKLEDGTTKEYALFLPNEPLKNFGSSGEEGPQVTWEEFNPPPDNGAF